MSCCDGDDTNKGQDKLKLLLGGAAFLILVVVVGYPDFRWSRFSSKVDASLEELGASPSSVGVAGLAESLRGLGKANAYHDLKAEVRIESRIGPSLKAETFLLVDLHAGKQKYTVERQITSTFDEEQQEELAERGVRLTIKRPKGHHH